MCAQCRGHLEPVAAASRWASIHFRGVVYRTCSRRCAVGVLGRLVAGGLPADPDPVLSFEPGERA
jgi:hypothetical protein